jgi:hypothetical protein
MKGRFVVFAAALSEAQLKAFRRSIEDLGAQYRTMHVTVEPLPIDWPLPGEKVIAKIPWWRSASEVGRVIVYIWATYSALVEIVRWSKS